MYGIVWKNKVYPHEEVERRVKKLLSDFLDYAFEIANKRGYPLYTIDVKNGYDLEYYIFSENDTITVNKFCYIPDDPIYCNITFNIIKEDQTKLNYKPYLLMSNENLFSKNHKFLFEKMFSIFFTTFMNEILETFIKNNFSSEQIKRFNYELLINWVKK